MKHLKEMYEYREMIFSLVKKDLRGRYKGSVLGFMWTLIINTTTHPANKNI